MLSCCPLILFLCDPVVVYLETSLLCFLVFLWLSFRYWLVAWACVGRFSLLKRHLTPLLCRGCQFANRCAITPSWLTAETELRLILCFVYIQFSLLWGDLTRQNGHWWNRSMALLLLLARIQTNSAHTLRTNFAMLNARFVVNGSAVHDCILLAWRAHRH